MPDRLGTLELKISFNDPFSEDVKKLLAESSRKIIFKHFETVLSQENAKKPYAYPPEGIEQHILHLAKKAFDRHSRNGGEPNDAVQQIMEEIDFMAEKSLKGDYGASLTQHVHPVIAFIRHIH